MIEFQIIQSELFQCAQRDPPDFFQREVLWMGIQQKLYDPLVRLGELRLVLFRRV
jgi:hypothetical protein